RLEQHAIARRQRSHDRQQRELHRVIPRTDDADYTAWLAQDAAPPRAEIKRRSNATRTHPPPEIAPRVADAGQYREQLGEPRFLRRADAEVGSDRRDELDLMRIDQRGEPIEPVGARGVRRIALGIERPSLRDEQRAESIAARLAAHALARAAAIASSRASGSCAPETAVQPLKMKNGTPVIPASCASRYSASTSARQASEASAVCASSRGRPQSAA